jgi:hypothetical protein
MNSDQTTWGAMKFKLRIYNVATGQPTTPPVMSFNSSGEKLTLSYEESYVKSGLRLCFSPKLKSMFDFSPQMRWDASQQHWEFIYPPLILNAVNSMVQYSQIYTSKSMVANLSRIVVLSASLATANDLVDGPLLSSKQTLADFLIDTSSNNLDTLTFSDGASFPSTWRIYRLKTSQPIHNVDLDVQAEYSNGESKTVVIPAGSSANIRISFFPRQY